MSGNTQMSRLDLFEAMLASVKTQYSDAVDKMEKLKAAGKEKTATYRKLMGNKMQFGSMLTMYQVFGLIDNPEKRE